MLTIGLYKLYSGKKHIIKKTLITIIINISIKTFFPLWWGYFPIAFRNSDNLLSSTLDKIFPVTGHFSNLCNGGKTASLVVNSAFKDLKNFQILV